MARVLVVDDNADMRQLLTTILGEEGHTVVVAPNGEKALETIDSDPPELLILDVMMPQMDGFRVLKELRNSGAREGLKILILTAKTSEHDWVRGYRLGAHLYLTKPFDVDELLGAVNLLLTSSPAELRARRAEELNKAQVLSRLESFFEG